MNTFGTILRLTTFGESHGKALGGVIDGCPAGLKLDMEYIQSETDRRRPGQSKIASQRKERDKVELLSGHVNMITTGAPLAFIILNEDIRSQDYSEIEQIFRPSHADYTFYQKYQIRDAKGGGRASARETVSRVVAGAIAKLLLKQALPQVEIHAWVAGIGELYDPLLPNDFTLHGMFCQAVHSPNPTFAKEAYHYIDTLRKEGDSIGGIIRCVMRGIPPGLGEPVFGKLHTMLGAAMLSIPAVKGFEYGSGFEGTRMKGSAHNDIFFRGENGEIRTQTNYSGGIQGGISNGESIYFRVAFKPTATILRPQYSIDIAGSPAVLSPKGRHDPCVVPRAVPIVEAMAAWVIADAFLLQRTSRM